MASSRPVGIFRRGHRAEQLLMACEELKKSSHYIQLSGLIQIPYNKIVQ